MFQNSTPKFNSEFTPEKCPAPSRKGSDLYSKTSVVDIVAQAVDYLVVSTILYFYHYLRKWSNL